MDLTVFELSSLSDEYLATLHSSHFLLFIPPSNVSCASAEGLAITFRRKYSPYTYNKISGSEPKPTITYM
jgi:hypothetical protein